jgi:hypothetical protein
MTLDQLYGCSLGEYLEYLGKTKEDLINELEKEIELLNKSRMQYAENKDKYTLEQLVESVEITELMDKKREHLKRIKAWS